LTSGSWGHGAPFLEGSASEDAERGTADQVLLGVEQIVDLRLEPLLFSLPPPDRQVAVLDAIVLAHAAKPMDFQNP
jgi:hypothetical protein